MTRRKRPLVERVALVIYDDQYGWGADAFDDDKSDSESPRCATLVLARRILRLVAREKKR